MAQASDNKVNLGCGTLILIAIIVLILGVNGRDRELRNEVNQMKMAVTHLKNEIARLRQTIENQQKENPPLHPK